MFKLKVPLIYKGKDCMTRERKANVFLDVQEFTKDVAIDKQNLSGCYL